MKRMIIFSLAFIFMIGMLAFSNGSSYKPGEVSKEKRLRSPLSPPSQEGVKPNFWKVEEDIFLYHFSAGKGIPVLVIHGGPGLPPTKPWKGLAALKESFKFYFYHQRGCGKSTRPVDRFESKNFLQNFANLDNVLGISAQLADIERIRRILKLDKVIIVGHSYGGFLATLYAVEFPEHVEKMVLIAPAGVLKMPVEEGGIDQLKDYLPEDMKSEYENFLSRYFNYGNIFLKSEKELAELNSEFVKFFGAALKTKGIELPEGSETDAESIGGWMVHAMYLSLGMKYDLRDELKKVDAPVLVVHGEKDVMLPSVSKEYADLFVNGEFKVVPKASHFPFFENPEEFAVIISDFLKKDR
jgi:proline iminopeptidase